MMTDLAELRRRAAAEVDREMGRIRDGERELAITAWIAGYVQAIEDTAAKTSLRAY